MEKSPTVEIQPCHKPKASTEQQANQQQTSPRLLPGWPGLNSHTQKTQNQQKILSYYGGPHMLTIIFIRVHCLCCVLWWSLSRNVQRTLLCTLRHQRIVISCKRNSCKKSLMVLPLLRSPPRLRPKFENTRKVNFLPGFLQHKFGRRSLSRDSLIQDHIKFGAHHLFNAVSRNRVVKDNGMRSGLPAS